MSTLDSPQVIDPKSVSPRPTILRYGLISGLVLVAYSMLGIATGLATPESGVALWILYSLISIVIAVLIMVLPIKKHRNEDLGGYIAFGRAFSVAFFTALIAYTISIFFSFIYTSFIDPDYASRTIEGMRGFYEMLGMTEEQIEVAIEQGKAQVEGVSVGKKLLSNLWTLLGGSAMGAILALIIAAIMQRKPPVENAV